MAAPFRPDLAEAAGDHDHGFDPAPATRIDDARHRCGRDDQHGQLHRIGHCGDVGIAAQPQYLVGFGVDRVDRAAIAAFRVGQIAHHAVADLGRIAAGADHGDAVGGEEGGER